MQGFHCATCGEYHDELPTTFGAPAPAAWYDLPQAEREQRAPLSSDQCIIDDTHHFVLGRLEIPIIGSPEPFVWLTWVTVSEADFYRTSELWETPGREREPPYAARVQSEFPYEVSTLNLKATLQTQALGDRPLVFVDAGDHPLALQQNTGITHDQARQLAERCLHP
ncbi:DUF2199 domain-containing protein [Pseudomonas sp. SD17-1]|uniref:DUF2199 domain-containing protein n=1 Tax=Pseudomonas TaxID=286 RepID=UPI000E22893E|nr:MULTISPECIES: DUF2199 domain-containing protein [Pseudomonas]MEC6743092.1 DUF2199 domain-containing protein [Pseudomonas qingdaonensis]UVL49809.1 DUF2199 domain-containing protein [Pseudomonas sp. B21-036]WEJ20240.1 DUF2199 domain-containing protein [Pseudomonas sp. SD17-1]